MRVCTESRVPSERRGAPYLPLMCPRVAIGHSLVNFPALLLGMDLQRRLNVKQEEVSRPDLVWYLSQVHSVMIDLDGNRNHLRTGLVGSSYPVFQAAGMRPRETFILRRPVLPGDLLSQLTLL